MTAIATSPRPAPRPSARRRARPALARVFAVATGIGVVHALDDAFLNRQPGVPIGQHALAAALAAGLGVAAALGFRFLRPGLRAMLALAFGSLALTNGALHVIHIAKDGPAGSDLTGALAAVAGAVLIGLAVAIPWRHRGEGAGTARRRWVNRAIAVPASLATVVFVVAPVALAVVETHKFREPVGSPPDGAYEAVAFSATDGLELRGWYRPSANGAAVLLVHGGGSDRTGAVAHAKLLARHGYGVLLYDARGRGESEGSPSSYGWGWEKDAAGALAFLRKRDDVQAGRIGGLGLSSGADTLIDVAADHPELRAVVADGAAVRTFEDARRLKGGVEPEAAPAWTLFEAMEILAGSSPPRPLEDLVARVSSPLLLVSAGRAVEYDYNVAYAAVAPGTAVHWNLPDAHHTAAIREHPGEYEQRVVGFLDDALR